MCFISVTVSERLELPVFGECMLSENESAQMRGNFFFLHLGMLHSNATAMIKIRPLHLLVRIPDFDPATLLLIEASIRM